MQLVLAWYEYHKSSGKCQGISQCLETGHPEKMLECHWSCIMNSDMSCWCCWLQEARYEEALQKFLQVQHVGGYRPDLAYNIALCQYMLKQYGAAHSCVGDIIAKGIKEHPGISSQAYMRVRLFVHCIRKKVLVYFWL